MGTKGERSVTERAAEAIAAPCHCWFKIWPSLCCCSVGKGCLMCRCHGNCGHNAGAHFLRTTTATPRLDPCSPRCPQHTSTPSRPLLLLFLASLRYFSCVFFCCCTFCVLFFFSLSLLPPPIAFPLKYLECNWGSLNWILEGNWGGFSASLAPEQGLFSPVTSRCPRCVAGGVGACEPSCLGAAHGRLRARGRCRCVQPDAAQEQVATRGDLPGPQNRRSSTKKENATQCKT